jgi:hypothetical protein
MEGCGIDLIARGQAKEIMFQGGLRTAPSGALFSIDKLPKKGKTTSNPLPKSPVGF